MSQGATGKRPTGKRRPVAPSDPGASEAAPVNAIAAPVAPDQADSPDPSPSADQSVSRRKETWRKRSATGAILSGFAFGLQQVFEPERKEPAIVMETSGDPPRDLPVEAELELATTRRSVVRIRPWLLDDAPSPEGDE